MRVVVIGRTGQLAQGLASTKLPQGWTARFLDRAALDLGDTPMVARLAAQRPELVINLAAYNAVDRAESEPDLAFQVNATGPGEIARWCAARSLPFVHVSTDYVFDGEATAPYREDDATGPLGVYGASKLAGEVAVRAAGGPHLLVRTAWLYGEQGRNFVTTMLDLAIDRPVIRVVDDQFGSPGHVSEVATGLVALAEAALAGRCDWGTWHLAGSGSASRAEFAEAVFAAARRHGLPAAEIERIPTSQYPTPARRPAYSSLSSERFIAATGIVPSPWRDAVDTTVAACAALQREPATPPPSRMAAAR